MQAPMGTPPVFIKPQILQCQHDWRQYNHTARILCNSHVLVDYKSYKFLEELCRSGLGSLLRWMPWCRLESPLKWRIPRRFWDLLAPPSLVALMLQMEMRSRRLIGPIGWYRLRDWWPQRQFWRRTTPENTLGWPMMRTSDCDPLAKWAKSFTKFESLLIQSSIQSSRQDSASKNDLSTLGERRLNRLIHGAWEGPSGWTGSAGALLHSFVVK